MPPSNSEDFNVHLERSLRDLDDLRGDLSYDVFMMYCNEDIPQPGQEATGVHPRKIYEDLKAAGFKV